MNQAPHQSMLWTVSKPNSNPHFNKGQLCAVVACVVGVVTLPLFALASDELGQPAPTKVADSGGASLEALLQRIDSLERKNKSLDTRCLT